MNIAVFTLFPELYKPFLTTSLIGRAQEKGLVTLDIQSLFSFCAPKERIDGPTFGPTAGMVIRPDVIERAVNHLEEKTGPAFKIFFSPQGKKLDQNLLQELYKKINNKTVALFPARYEGMDARIEEQYADEIISIGDYVLMGGDLPAMVLLEGLLRLAPGIIGREESVQKESFSGPFVDYPEYTAPVEWQGLKVPDIIRSGNHKAIEDWRADKAAEKTVLQHFDWLRSHKATPVEEQRAARFIPPHYAALMHTNVMLPDNREGTTSVTSIDIHDIARSARTYNLKNYFIVTPLEDQQKIVKKLLDFWQTGSGVAYNNNRHDALNQVRLEDSLDSVVQEIEKREGKKPLLIGTSARESAPEKIIFYYDQEKVWHEKRPVLFIFGTGHGLSSALLDRCDYILPPLRGFSNFNHLSVRSAAAIIFDRWLGINQKL